MRTLTASLGRKVLSNSFEQFISHSLTKSEMNYIRGGGDPPADEPIDVILPWPPRR